MQIKKTAYFSYYSLIAVILLAQAAFTIYQVSLTVGHGRQSKNLHQQQTELAFQQQQLQSQVAKKLSLVQLSNGEFTDFQTISQPILINPSTSLAAAQ